MCKTGSVLVALFGGSCLAAVFVITRAAWVSHPPTGVAGVLGAMSFALAAVIEIDV